MFKKYILVFWVVPQLLFLGASYSNVNLNSDAEDYNEMARKKTYPGGSLEEEIKVQESLTEPTLTIYKTNVDNELIKDFQNKGKTSEGQKE
jgi:hypothetical protein